MADSQSVRIYVKGCILSAKRKAHYFWQRVGMDILGPVPESSAGNKYVLVIGEYLSRYIEAVAMPDQTASTVSQAFITTILLRHGAPSEVLTDQGPQFQSELMDQLYAKVGIKKLRTTAYSPKTNGFVEKANRLFGVSLTMYANDNPREWCTHLPYVTYAYNTSVQASINEAPFW